MAYGLSPLKRRNKKMERRTNMDTSEAIKAISEGEKITHKRWIKGHYIKMDFLDNSFVDENGIKVSILSYLPNGFEIYKEDILKDEERAYLKYLIHPFREKIVYIIRCKGSEKYDYIQMVLEDDEDSTDNCLLPKYEKGKHYANMEYGKTYTLDDLKL